MIDGACQLFKLPAKGKAKKAKPKDDPVFDYVQLLKEAVAELPPKRKASAYDLISFYEEQGRLSEKQVKFAHDLIGAAIKARGE